MNIDLVLLVQRLEEVGDAADGLRRAQEQESSMLERIVERGQRLLLQARLEIDEQVAATDEVHLRERRVGDEILPCKNHHLAQRLRYAVTALLFDEEAPQALWRDVLDETLGVEALAGPVEERLVEVSGKDLKRAHAGRLFRRFQESHGDRIRLLPGGASDYPAAQRIVATLLEELEQHVALEDVERLGVAEEARDADEHIGVESVELLGVAAEKIGVSLEGVLLVEHQPPGDAPLNRGGFVAGEIHAGVVAQPHHDVLVAVLSVPGGLGRRAALGFRSRAAGA